MKTKSTLALRKENVAALRSGSAKSDVIHQGYGDFGREAIKDSDKLGREMGLACGGSREVDTGSNREIGFSANAGYRRYRKGTEE